MQESAREKDREYQKLKASSYHSSEENGILLHNACYYQNHFDKIKRKALLAPNTLPNEGFSAPLPVVNNETQNNNVGIDRHINKGRGNMFTNTGGVNAVVNGMEANGVRYSHP